MSERNKDHQKDPDKRDPNYPYVLEFRDMEYFSQSIRWLHRLSKNEPVKYKIGGTQGIAAILLSENTYHRLVPILKIEEVKYEEGKTAPMKSLPPEVQAKLRGLKR